MSILQIPPADPVPAPPQTSRTDGGDLYDPHRWESAYRDMHDVPALLIQMQDDLSRSRMREAFWISVIVHIVLIIAIVNADKLARLLPERPVLVVSPDDWMRQKELTYLELPPDAQKLSKRPETGNISDKDRIATSRAPQLNRDELKKIIDSSRTGMPNPSGPPPQPQAAPPPGQDSPQAQPQTSAATPPQPLTQEQMAKLAAPPTAEAKPNFTTPRLSAGSAIEQAARAALANRGAGYGGDSGDFGLGQGREPSKAVGELDVLSDTMGVDFGPYLSRVLHDVRQNWYNIIPEVARAPIMKKGKVSIEFAIMKDGKIAGMRLDFSSNDVALDRAAWGGITASNPFPPLPAEFAGQYLALRFHFFYNPDKPDLR